MPRGLGSDRELDEVVAGCAAAHQRLLIDLDPLVDGDVGRPTLLPGWTVGHVLTHLARSADSHIRVFEAAARGESVERYPGGREQRAADIEAGADRPAAEQVADVRRSIWALESIWAQTPIEAWGGTGLSAGAREPVVDLPFLRWREVEVHHADLGWPAFGIDDWSPGYVRRELERAEMAWAARRPMGMTALPPAALALSPAQRLAWMLGRRSEPGLPAVPQWW